MNKLTREVDIANIRMTLKEAAYQLDRSFSPKSHSNWADSILECLEKHEKELKNVA